MKLNRIFIDGRTIRPPYSGVAQYTARLLQHLNLDSFDYCLATNNLGDVDRFYSDLGVNTPPVVNQVGLPRPVWTALLRYAPFGGRWLPTVHDADLIHITQFEPFPKHLKKSTKRVLTVHDLIFLDHPEWFTNRNLNASKLALSQLLRDQIECVLTPSQFTKNRLIETGYGGRIEVTPLASTIDTAVVELSTSLDDELIKGKPYFLYIGNLEPRKGLVNLIHAWKESSSRNSFRLVLAGRYAYLSDEIRIEIDSAISEGFDVVQLGYITETRKKVLLENAYCLLYPSESEGFGIPVLDAMSSGLPVISCLAGSIPEIAAGFAHLIQPGQVGALSKAIDELATNVSYRNELALLGQRHAMKYSWKKTAELTENIYRDLL
jgi:glycosyltransferase involved in cell wall biosynthesis